MILYLIKASIDVDFSCVMTGGSLLAVLKSRTSARSEFTGRAFALASPSNYQPFLDIGSLPLTI
jgi:hypothetical protein